MLISNEQGVSNEKVGSILNPPFVFSLVRLPAHAGAARHHGKTEYGQLFGAGRHAGKRQAF